MPIAKFSDAEIHYEWTGPESSPVLLFSNSLGTNCDMWDGQIESFTRHFRVLRYDTRGHGGSSVPPGPYNIDQLTHDVIHLLDYLRLDHLSFCGLSMGGTTGMLLAANYAHRFHRIVLCNTAAKIGTPESWQVRIDAVRNGGMKAVAGAVIERWFTFDFRASHTSEVAEIQQMLEATNPEGYIANCAAIRDADMRDAISTITLPVLVVAGKHDPATTLADARAIADAIPGARVVELPAAHLSNIEARDDFNREVLSFLQS